MAAVPVEESKLVICKARQDEIQTPKKGIIREERLIGGVEDLVVQARAGIDSTLRRISSNQSENVEKNARHH